jgi:hypothetical protein
MVEQNISAEVKQRLVDNHITCIKVRRLNDMDDWVSVQFVPSQSADSALTIRMSVRNGVSVNYQLIRWERAMAIPGGQQTSARELIGAIDSLVQDLAANFDSPGYRNGRMANP